MKELKRANIEFKLRGNLIKFTIVHNLPKTFGLSLEDALQNWLVRTDIFTADSLCKYIMSKHTEYVAMTEETFQEILSYGK